EVVAHPTRDWGACTIDGWDEALACPIEAKHVAGFEPTEVIIDRYQPQCHWQMECTKARQCALSIIRGANEPIVEYIDFEQAYADQLIERGAQFMAHVRAGTAPVEMLPIAPPIDPTRLVDMTGNNQWCMSAAAWLASKETHDRCRDASEVLKSLVPADA